MNLLWKHVLVFVCVKKPISALRSNHTLLWVVDKQQNTGHHICLCNEMIQKLTVGL